MLAGVGFLAVVGWERREPLPAVRQGHVFGGNSRARHQCLHGKFLGNYVQLGVQRAGLGRIVCAIIAELGHTSCGWGCTPKILPRAVESSWGVYDE